MYQSYLKRIKRLEDCFDFNNEEFIKVLNYDRVQNGEIKATFEVGLNDNGKTIYFNSEKEIEKFNNVNQVSFCTS